MTAFNRNRSKPPRQEISCDVSLKIYKKQYQNHPQVINLIEQVFKFVPSWKRAVARLRPTRASCAGRKSSVIDFAVKTFDKRFDCLFE